MGKRDTSGNGQMRKADPSKWEKPHDYGEGRHAGELKEDNDNKDDTDNNDDD